MIAFLAQEAAQLYQARQRAHVNPTAPSIRYPCPSQSSVCAPDFSRNFQTRFFSSLCSQPVAELEGKVLLADPSVGLGGQDGRGLVPIRALLPVTPLHEEAARGAPGGSLRGGGGGGSRGGSPVPSGIPDGVQQRTTIVID